MNLSVELTESEITLKLVRGSQTIDFEKAKYYHNISDLLISSLDNIARRNNIDTSAIKSFKMLGNLGENSTSHKIAAAFIEGLRVKI